MPPGTERYVERIASPRRPLRLPGRARRPRRPRPPRAAAPSSARSRPGTPDRALLTLAPLFERHDPAAVAAALYELWTDAAGATVPAALPDIPATARVYVGIGKKDGATVNDLVAVLTKDVRRRAGEDRTGRAAGRVLAGRAAGPGRRAGGERAQRDDDPAAAGDGAGGPGRPTARRRPRRGRAAAPRRPARPPEKR